MLRPLFPHLWSVAWLAACAATQRGDVPAGPAAKASCASGAGTAPGAVAAPKSPAPGGCAEERAPGGGWTIEEQVDEGVLVAVARDCALLAARRLAEDGPIQEARAAAARGVAAGEAALLRGVPALAERLAAGAAVEEELRARPDADVAAVYWYAASLSAYAMAQGLAASVRFHRRIAGLFALVIARDETYAHAGAHRLLGTYLSRAPATGSGDLARARAHFERALELDPFHLPNRLAFAEHYATAARDRELFQRLLREVAGTTPGTPAAAGQEAAASRARAARLLARIDELF